MLADIIPKIAGMTQGDPESYYPRPSMASPSTPEDPGRCIRAMTYARLGIPHAPWPGRFLLVLDDSSWHEELTLDWIRKSAYTVHSCQLPVDYPLPRPIGAGGYCRRCRMPVPNTILHGHIDALFSDLLGTTRLMEHKAINHFGFHEILKGQPEIDHLTQGSIYLVGARRVPPGNHHAGPASGVLLYKSKNTSAYCEFHFNYDQATDTTRVYQMVASEGIDRELNLTYPSILSGAIAKFETVERYAKENTLPPRPYRVDHYRCDYCPWSARCWDGYPDEVKGRDAITTLDPTVAPLLTEYAEAATMKRLGEATTKRLRPQILRALEAHHTQTGIANGYRATATATTRATLDESLIPNDIRQAAQVTKVVEVLRVVPTRQTNDSAEGE